MGRTQKNLETKSQTLIARDLMHMELERLAKEFRTTVQGLAPARLAWRPTSRSNSIGFTVWHCLRSWDMYLNYLDGSEELYFSEDWARRFGFDTGVKRSGNIGTDYTAEEVAQVTPSAATLNAYLDAIWERTVNYLDAANGQSLARPVRIPWWPGTVPHARVLVHILRHSYLHLGEAEYLKGVLRERSRTKTRSQRRMQKD